MDLKKINSLFNLITRQPDTDRFHLCLKYSYEAKHRFLIDKQKIASLKHFNDAIAFIEYQNNIDGIYKKIEEYNPKKKGKVLIVFGDMIGLMLSKTNLNPILTELFIRGRKLNISLAFITQSYFTVPKNIRSNSTHSFIRKIINKRELQEIAFNHSSKIELKDYQSS